MLLSWDNLMLVLSRAPGHTQTEKMPIATGMMTKGLAPSSFQHRAVRLS